MNKALLIYNPKAGSAAGPELWLGQCIHRLCTEGNYQTTVVSTRIDTTAENLLDNTPADVQLYVAAGGDGTVRMVIDALAKKNLQTDIGIVPLGTGNLLARNLSIFEESLLTDPVEKAIDIILRGQSRNIDLGILNGHYFAAAAGTGPLSDAIVTPDRRDKENWKMLAYAGSMMQTLAQPPVHFKVTADGEVFRIAASGIFVTNIADLGVGMLSESASMYDGLLDLCILSPKEFGDYLHYGFHFATGAGLISGGKSPYYTKKVKCVDIEVVAKKRPLSFIQQGWNKFKSSLTGRQEGSIPGHQVLAMIDGDACGSTPIHIEVAPAKVSIMCPAPGNQRRI